MLIQKIPFDLFTGIVALFNDLRIDTSLQCTYNNIFSSYINEEKTFAFDYFPQFLGPFGSCSQQLCRLYSRKYMSTKEEFQTLLGHNLRRIRRDKNYTVEDLGFESGLGYSQVSRIELGKRNPTAYTLFMLSKALNVCPSEFFKPQSSDVHLP